MPESTHLSWFILNKGGISMLPAIIVFSKARYRAHALVLILASLAVAGMGVAPGRLPGSRSDQKQPPSPDSRRPLELRDFYRIENASNPAISPDGRFVAYVRTYMIEAENRRQSEIWLASTEGPANPKRLTDQA